MSSDASRRSVQQAVDAGAALEVESRVRQITWHGDEVIVQTDRQAYRAGGLICCAALGS